MKKVFYCLILMLLFGCGKEDVEPQLPKIYEYRVNSMLYPIKASHISSKVKLNYDKDSRIVHRIGDLISVNPNSGVSYVLSENIADTLIYKGNSIVITKHIVTGENWLTSYRRELLIKDGMLVRKVFDDDYYGMDYYGVNDFDTVLYYYNGYKQVEKTSALNPYRQMDSKFKYDENGNLSMVVSETYYRDTNDTFYKDTLRFSDYDNSPNLTKELILFEECFFRSLSVNNFRKYSFKRVNLENDQVSTEERSWAFYYDENNYVIY
ncbi:MAG: hypothetical protein AAGU19_21345 [Prolixibacteraceae bacterium]